MRLPRPRSISVVVATVLVAVTTLVLTIFGALDYRARRAGEWRRLRGALAAEADQLALALALPVWNIDRSQIDKVIEGVGATPAVAFVSVTAAGRVHARARDSS
jgi:hypothetical protein